MQSPLQKKTRAAGGLACLAAVALTLLRAPSLEAAPVRVSDQATPLSSFAKIDGQQGGTLKAGRWTVTVPPGAYKGNATIVITVPNQSVMLCTLDILPASSNKFDLPVVLTANCKAATVNDPSQLTLVWFNPSTMRWEPVAGSMADASWTVTAPLGHFSIYAVDGKAGW